MAETTNRSHPKCAFCERGEKEAIVLIPARDNKSYICASCVGIFSDFLDAELGLIENEETESELSKEALPRPKEIKALLDEHVIGQEDAIARITDADGNHFVYEVALLETLHPTSIQEMKHSNFDLTLFTCTVGGKMRVTVRCERVE